jgi:hypothetical protein
VFSFRFFTLPAVTALLLTHSSPNSITECNSSPYLEDHKADCNNKEQAQQYKIHQHSYEKLASQRVHIGQQSLQQFPQLNVSSSKSITVSAASVFIIAIFG